MKRLWILISGYEDARGLETACRSVRTLWPDPRTHPIVYSDGAYAKFPHDECKSSSVVLDVARKYASFIVEWPIASPTEYIKRTTYWAGNQGDYALILDADETVHSNTPAGVPRDLIEPAYLVGIRTTKAKSHQGRVSRLFRIEKDIHHWGAHEVVFRGDRQLHRAQGKATDSLYIVHTKMCSEERRAAKKEYYGRGIQEDEADFRRKVGA